MTQPIFYNGRLRFDKKWIEYVEKSKAEEKNTTLQKTLSSRKKISRSSSTLKNRVKKMFGFLKKSSR